MEYPPPPGFGQQQETTFLFYSTQFVLILCYSFVEPMKKIKELYEANKKKEADLALADFVLSSNRKGKLIRFLLPYYVTLKPTSGPGIESKREEKDDDPLAYFIEQQQGTDEL